MHSIEAIIASGRKLATTRFRAACSALAGAALALGGSILAASCPVFAESEYQPGSKARARAVMKPYDQLSGGEKQAARQKFLYKFKQDKHDLDSLYAYLLLSADLDAPEGHVAFCNLLIQNDQQAIRFPRIYHLRAMSKQYEDDDKGAVEDCTTAIRLKQGSYYVYLTRGSSYDALGQYQKAIDDYTMMEKLKGTIESTMLYERRARSREALKQYAAAIGDWDKAILRHAGSVNFISARAADKERLGRDLDALKDYDYAVKMQPADDLPYLLRGKMLVKLGRYKEAVADLSQSIKLDSDPSPTVYKLRAEAYRKLGMERQARADLDSAARF